MNKGLSQTLDFKFGYSTGEHSSSFRKDLWGLMGADSLKANLLYGMCFKSFKTQLTFKQSLESFFKRIHDPKKPLYILYSGGIDSEVLLETAIDLDLSPIPITVYIEGQNQYDLEQAQKYLKTKKELSPLMVSVSKSDLKKKWLSEFFEDTECVEYFYIAAYIAARSAPKGANVVVMGDGPNPIVYESNNLYHVEFEHNYWPLKLRLKRDLQLWDPYWDCNVVQSFLRYPSLSERIKNPPPFEKWYFNVSWMGKEYFYNDPDFCHLQRRFSQHGWETQTADLGYCKELTPSYNVGMVNPYTTGYYEKHSYKHFFNKNLATELMLQHFDGSISTTQEVVDILFENLPTVNKFEGHYSVLARNIYGPLYTNVDQWELLSTSAEGHLLGSL